MFSRTIAPGELDAVLSRYTIGALSAPPEPGGGTANANMTLETETGKYFLKRRNPKYSLQSYVAFDHRLMEHLAPFRLGTPLAVPADVEGDG
jgi:Ser/Thr protein kinase RdoA (MazF antagonist)